MDSLPSSSSSISPVNLVSSVSSETNVHVESNVHRTSTQSSDQVPNQCDTDKLNIQVPSCRGTSKLSNQVSSNSVINKSNFSQVPSQRGSKIQSTHPRINSCNKFEIVSAQSTLVKLFEEVYRSGVPNYKGCRTPLPFNKFNIPLWRDLLSEYSDNIICDFLEFGFPLDFDKSVTLRTNERRNHRGAKQHPEYVTKYLNNEIEKCRIAGPFECNPFSIPIMVSPLNTVPKASSDERRVIVDLSWPIDGGSLLIAEYHVNFTSRRKLKRNMHPSRTFVPWYWKSEPEL